MFRVCIASVCDAAYLFGKRGQVVDALAELAHMHAFCLESSHPLKQKLRYTQCF